LTPKSLIFQWFSSTFLSFSPLFGCVKHQVRLDAPLIVSPWSFTPHPLFFALGFLEYRFTPIRTFSWTSLVFLLCSFHTHIFPSYKPNSLACSRPTLTASLHALVLLLVRSLDPFPQENGGWGFQPGVLFPGEGAPCFFSPVKLANSPRNFSLFALEPNRLLKFDLDYIGIFSKTF